MADLPTFRLITGDCFEVMAAMPEASVDAIVTDPPYGLEFMGKEWDRLAGDWGGPDTQVVRDATRGRTKNPYDGSVTPRYHTRGMQDWHHAWATQALRVLKPGGHLLAFGGTRTYHRLACAIEDAGFEIRDCLAWMYGSGFPKSLDVSKAIDKAAGAEREVVGPAQRVDGQPRNYEAWAPHRTNSMAGTLPQAGPPITGPATPDAQTWQGWGTALKPAYEPIVLARKPLVGTVAGNVLEHGTGALNVDGCRIEGERWPANALFDEEAAQMLNGSARFFYTSKASSAERNRGTDERNSHPTVKPVDLMQWLVRLVTPPGGTVLDPFTGSGSTGMAALREGFTFIGIEREPEYVEIARSRIVGDAPLFNVEVDA